MRIVPVDQLQTADLHVDACYQGGRFGNAADDPLPPLLRVDSQGGFRYRGKVAGRLEMLALTSSMSDPDWPDHLDRETGVFTYYGDNKKPGRELHDTGRDGNLILQRIFTASRQGAEGRASVPPIFLFARAGTNRDQIFLGLAVPGASDLDASEELVAIWRTAGGSRFQNYRARFTVLDTAVISREWIDTIIAGRPDDKLASKAWRNWVRTGRRLPLIASRSLEHRTRAEQLPNDGEGEALVAVIRRHFADRPHAFEYCAAAIARLMMPDIATLDVTRPSRDGGRDAVGQMRVGSGPSAILVDFALEAKCYTPPNAVGVRDVSRLISRLRHRQFGILVTTSCVDLQAYKEVKEDGHPIIIIAAADIVDLLRRNGRGTVDVVSAWLAEEFPHDRDRLIDHQEAASSVTVD
ncbi:MAG: restriction endonuclease [Mesorhizobium sp.]|nr:MAG: restriction endonuclease [Mesorhizobium sp.]